MKKKQTLHPLTLRCKEELKTALKLFGTYQFDDKGPGEVMDMSPIGKSFRALSVEEAARVYTELCADTNGRAEMVALDLLMMNDDWDELFAHKDIPDTI